MFTLLLIIHVMVCIFLIFIVLIQSGKGAELGAAFGGSSQTLFGSRGAATFFSKLTTIAAIVFMLSSLSLAVVSAKTGSVVKKTIPLKEKGSVPPAQGPAQGGGVQPSQQLPSQPTK
ncbi:MAG: preprotein translocase subunit SecG [Nitrospirae bacterium]|nr:preprotein translocase subunit SecG [Nitrospirota bacterium]